MRHMKNFWEAAMRQSDGEQGAAPPEASAAVEAPVVADATQETVADSVPHEAPADERPIERHGDGPTRRHGERFFAAPPRRPILAQTRLSHLPHAMTTEPLRKTLRST